MKNGEPSYNLFGVKASDNWKGPVTEITTTEYENGEAKKVKAKFRVYSSYLEALSDYVGLLTRNPRYAAVTTAASAEQGAQALQDAGYATDPSLCPQTHQHDSADEIDKRQGEQNLQHEH